MSEQRQAEEYRKGGTSLRQTLLPLLIAAGAFFINVYAGRRGIFPFDQSIVFDGGYRIYSGQIPFVDFYAPHGLLPYYLQAIAFQIWGVDFDASLFAGGILNAIAAMTTWHLIKTLFIGQSWLALIAAALTSLWCYAPMSTLYFEQTGFVLGLMALYMVVIIALRPSGSVQRDVPFFALSGALIGLTILCKQNVGLLLMAVPVVPALWWSRGELNRLFQGLLVYCAAVISIITSTGYLLFEFSNPGIAFDYLVRLPIAIAMRRLSQRGLANVYSSIETPWIAITACCLIIGLFYLLWSALKLRRQQWLAIVEQNSDNSRITLAAALLATLILLSWAYLFTAYNNPSVAYVYIGVAVGLFGGIWPRICQAALGAGSGISVGQKTLAALTVFSLFAIGIILSFSRKSQEAVDRASFGDPMNISGMRNVRWGDPTYAAVARRVEISESELLELIKFLRRNNKPFFVFPDFTFLYGVVGLPSRQPLLWFHSGVSYPNEYDSRLDQLIVSRLEQSNIEFVILEKDSFFGTEDRLRAFPILAQYISQGFDLQQTIGIFEIRSRRSQKLDNPMDKAIEGAQPAL